MVASGHIPAVDDTEGPCGLWCCQNPSEPFPTAAQTIIDLPLCSGSDHYQEGDGPEACDVDAPIPVADLAAATVIGVLIVALGHR